MLSVRVSFTKKEEAKEAKKLAKAIATHLRKKGYRVRTSNRIYWNKRKGSGGRIYINVFPSRMNS